MEFIKIAFLAFIHGVTEFLPISSTAHVVILSKLIKLSNKNFLEFLEIGSTLALCVYYRKKFHRKNFRLLMNLVLGFIPIVFFMLFYKVILGLEIPEINMSYSLIGIGLLMILIKERDLVDQKDLSTMSFLDVLIIGVTQVFAIFPGVSRSGITIISGIYIGLNIKSAVEFSFLLSIPTMFATSIYKLGKLDDFAFDYLIVPVVVFLFSIIFLQTIYKLFSMRMIKIIGVYRVILGIIMLFFGESII